MTADIKFSIPKINSLKKQGYICVDMHFHTPHSDGAATVDQILKKIRKLGIGISITDHTEISGALEAFDKKKESDFIIPGIELRSKEDVDILFYFYKIDELKEFFKKEVKPHRIKILRYYKLDLSLEHIHSLSKKYNCVACVPHPFGYSVRAGSRKTFEKYEHILKKFSVIEAINSGTSLKNNQKAVDVIKKSNKCFTGGSDGHSSYALGNVITYSKAKTIKHFLDNIKNKKNKVVGIPNKHGKLTTYFNWIKNKLKTLM